MVGHIWREESGIGRTLLLGSVYGPQGKGRPKTRLIEDVVKVCGGVCAAVEMARDRERWRSSRPRRIGHDSTVDDDLQGGGLSNNFCCVVAVANAAVVVLDALSFWRSENEVKVPWLKDSSEKIFVLTKNFDDTFDKRPTLNLAMLFESGDL